MAKIIFSLLLLMLIVIFCAMLFSLPVMWLWNWVGVDVLSLKPIGWAQAWGLLCLSGFLFKSQASKGGT